MSLSTSQSVQQAGLQQLNDGQRISFDVEPDRRGKTSAINLKAV
jgi:cold shock CspA family protein